MNKQLILLDTSYISFYRFFATLRWFTLAHKDEYKIIKDNEINNNKQYDWSTDTIFMTTYKKMYLESIVKLVKKKNFKDSIIIFCLDASRNTLWRKEIFPLYKEGREDLSLKANYKHVFNYTYNNIIPNIINDHNNVFSLKFDSIEADDIIACITQFLKIKNPTQKIIILSGDDDFIQLGRLNVNFINFKTKTLLEISEDYASKRLRAKILLGDKSDGILSIFPSSKKELTNAKRLELINSSEQLLLYLKNNNKVYEKYITNQKLIDFNFIPDKYYDKIIKEYEKQINKFNNIMK